MPLTEVMLTIEPPSSCSCMNELAAWAQYSGASRLSDTMEAENRGEAVAASADGEPPALLTRVSIRPKRVTADSTTAAAWSASRTSPVTNTAVRTPPEASVAVGSWSAAGWCRPQTTTSAPAARKASLMPRPMPRAPPVTTTTRPLKSSPLEVRAESNVATAASRSRLVLS